jgi:hypothetical protein
MIKRETVYFEQAGPENSADCLKIVKRLVEEGAKHVVVASTRGETGLLFAEGLPAGKASLVVVAHSAGFQGTGVVEFEPSQGRAIEAKGGKVCRATMPFHGVESAIEKQFSGTLPSSLIAHALRVFGQGAKVCCEIVMMTADAGLIPEGEEVVAAGGTRWGADTVLVIRSAASRNFLNLKVLEIAAKPRG